MPAAQNGVYIIPSFGAGIAQSKGVGFENLGFNSKGVFAYKGEIGIDLIKNDFDICAGISYFQTGLTQTYTFQNQYGPPFADKVIRRFNHFALPVSVGYRVQSGERFSIVPQGGLLFSYNASEDVTIPGNLSLMEPDFSAAYHRLSVFVLGQLNLEYKINDRTTILAGPEAIFMIGNMIKESFGASQNDNAYLLNIGLKCALNGKSKAQKKSLTETK